MNTWTVLFFFKEKQIRWRRGWRRHPNFIHHTHVHTCIHPAHVCICTYNNEKNAFKKDCPIWVLKWILAFHAHTCETTSTVKILNRSATAKHFFLQDPWPAWPPLSLSQWLMARIPGQESRHAAKACLSAVPWPESASGSMKDFSRRNLRPPEPPAQFCYEPLTKEKKKEEEDKCLFERKEKLVFRKERHKYNKKTCIRTMVIHVQSLRPV